METERQGDEPSVQATRDLAFLQELAADPGRAPSDAEREATEAARRSLAEADGVVALLGGRSGRLGECVVGTALLEGALQAQRIVGRSGIPVRLVVDAVAAELFAPAPYEAVYWPGFAVLPAPAGAEQDTLARALDTLPAGKVVVLDLHGGHDGSPELRREQPDGIHRVATLARLFRTGIRAYAGRGPLRRYADFIEDLFALPRGRLDGAAVQPTLRLAPDELAAYSALANRLGLRPAVPLVVAFFQSVVAAKCYTRWDEVLALLCTRLKQDAPDAQLDILLACGPDDAALPEIVSQASLEDAFGSFSGAGGNARVVIATIPSLRELAIVLGHAALVLADDTGPAHMAGALGVPVVTPYLPGNVYSLRVWASSPHHHGVTLDPNPYTFEQIRDAVLWDSTHIIDEVSPDALARAALDALRRRHPA